MGIGIGTAVGSILVIIFKKFHLRDSYTPKATVQAAIGAIPFTMGLACGQTVLTVAVLSIQFVHKPIPL